jgi:flagellin
MSLVVNTNLTSLVTQNYLSTSQNQLAQATTRLASGLRINSAADDAAGYAISQRLTAQVNGANTAVQNANNGVSLVQTAQGSLAQITSNLQTVRQLAVESANATNSTSDRQSLNNEAQQLLQEVDRVAASANFNGVNLLDGSFTNQQFQVGANAGDTISIASISSARISQLGTSNQATVTTGALAVASTGTNLSINGSFVGATTDDSSKALAAAINAAQNGVVATAGAASYTGGAAPAATGGTLASGDLVINGINITGSATNATGTVGLINNNSAATGVSASLNGSGNIVLSAADGRNINVTANANATTVSGLSTGVGTGAVTLTSSSAITIGGGDADFTQGTVAATQTGTALSQLDLSTVAGSNAALTSIDAALNSINTSNANLGAYQNRFQSAVASTQAESQNLTAARSTIEDTDFAATTAAETRASVLQQAGVAVLGQANSQPQQILSLLQHL